MSERLSFTLHELVSAIDGYADGILRENYGVDANLFITLATMSEEPGRIDVTTLARCLGVSKAAVSKRVPSLVDAGWLETHSDPTNARRLVLTLTPRAIDLVERAGSALDAEFASMLAKVPGIDPAALNLDLIALTRVVLAHAEHGTAPHQTGTP